MSTAGGKKARGRGGGGGGRGVRGVDFGLGIGYSLESTNTPSHSTPGRSAAVNSLKTGMMAQFKSNFVAASSSSPNLGLSNSSSAGGNKRPALRGFVSGGSIGGDLGMVQSTSSLIPSATSGGDSTAQNLKECASQKNSER